MLDPHERAERIERTERVPRDCFSTLDPHELAERIARDSPKGLLLYDGPS